MKKCSIALLVLLAFSALTGQTRFSGYVVDSQTGQALANANILIKGTYRGTITNSDGKYELSLKKLPAVLIVSYIGYTTREIHLTPSSDRSLTIQLDPTVIQLRPITVSDEDPAINIMRKVIRSKEKWLSALSNYRVDAYSRISLENDTSIVYLAESKSRLFWNKDKGNKEVIVSKKESANIKSTENFAFASNLQNLYDNDIDVAGFTLVGVTNPKALKHYNFTLTNYRSFNGKTVYDIEVAPKSKLQPALKGRISVVDEDYAIIDVDLEPSEAVILPPPFQDFKLRYKQQFRKFGNLYWLPVDMRMKGSIKLGTVGFQFPNILYNQVSVFTEYKVNTSVPDSILTSKKSVMIDSLSLREKKITAAPVPLTRDEETAYQELDSTMTLARAFKPTGFLAKHLVVEARSDAASASTAGNGTKKKKKSLLSYINPRIQYNRVTGFGPGIGISLDRKHIDAAASADYYAGIKKAAWSADVKASWGPLSLSAGYSSGADTRFSTTIYPAILTSAAGFIGTAGYHDYFWNDRFRTRLTVTAPRLSAALHAGFNVEEHSSLSETSTFTLLGKGRTDRINPAVNDGRLGSVCALLSFGYGRIPFAPIGRNRISLYVEHSSRDLFSSDFDFTLYRVSASARINTFLRRRLLPPCIDIFASAGTSTGTLPVQKTGFIDGAMSGLTPFGAFKTMSGRPVEGEDYAAVFAEYNLRTLPFEILGLRSLAHTGLGIIIHGGIGRTWTHSLPSVPGVYEPVTLNSTYSEAGFSINGLFDFARLDFAVPLNRKGFYAGVSLARMF